jgi:two-component system, OmpR family, response regulator
VLSTDPGGMILEVSEEGLKIVDATNGSWVAPYGAYDHGMPRNTARVLLVEDDTALREAVAAALRAEGYDVLAAEDGLGLRERVTTFRPDLAVLDVRLPAGPSGLSITRLLRAEADLPILLLTAADGVPDRLAGFEAGADDYVVKPFAMTELLARIQALLRRSGRVTSETWQIGDLVVDEASRTVHRGGELLDLTRTEFDLLTTLHKSRSRVVSKAHLLTAVWGFDAYDPNLVEVHISALRRKLEAHGPRLIHTVRGAGYRLQG